MSNTLHRASSFTVDSNTYTLHQYNSMIPATRRVEKTVYETDPLGNKLYKPNGKPKMVTICVNEPVNNANVALTQTPSNTVDHTNQQQGRGRNRNTNGNEDRNRPGNGKDNSNKGYNNGNNGGQSRQLNNNSNRNNTAGGARGNSSTLKCSLCNGDHTNLMYCSKFTEYLPFGNKQLKPPASLCLQCLSTKDKNARNCTHVQNRYYKQQRCKTTKKHYLMCTDCTDHVAALKIGFKNF